MKKIYWGLTYLRDKDIPQFLVSFIDWVRYLEIFEDFRSGKY